MQGLIKIIDTMMVPLAVKDKKITGSSTVRVKTQHKGLELVFNVRALDFCEPEDLSSLTVLFHVGGDLYVLVGWNKQTETLSAFLINAAKVVSSVDGQRVDPSKKITRGMTLKEAVESFNRLGAISSTYFKVPTKSEWVKYEME